MTLDNETATRRKSLEFHAARLMDRVARLEARSQRFSWYRLGALLAGGVLTWAGVALGGGRWVWWAFLLSVSIFVGVVFLHRRLDRWTRLLKIWQDIRVSQLARLTLNWDQMPVARRSPRRRMTPLEIDLDLTGERSLHRLMDITISHEGSSLLAEWLTRSIADDPGRLSERQALVRELASLPRFRDRLLLAFRLVSTELLRGDRLVQWLELRYPIARLRWVVPVAGLLVLFNLTLFFLNSIGQLPAFWVVSLAVYAGFYYFNFRILNSFLKAVVQLDSELDKFRAVLTFLETYPLDGSDHLLRFCAPFRDQDRLPSRQLRKIKLATAAVGLRSNPVLGFLINLVLPWDFFFAHLTARYQDQAAETIPRWLEAWHRLEALLCLADFAHLHPNYTFPEIEPRGEPVLEATALGHPLLPLETKVVNDIAVGELGEILIITGSNMAGKSTFIKTIGINLCLAYAGAPVDARQFRTIPFFIHTCIRISDSLTDGYSYFYEEVRCLRRLLERVRADTPPPVMFLVDEIFRGTNNRERLIGSRSYLRALIGQGCVGFLATHDLELASLADQSERVRNFHFRDQVADGQLVFDFRLRSGPSPTTNALRIMEMEGLPVEPVEDPGV